MDNKEEKLEFVIKLFKENGNVTLSAQKMCKHFDIEYTESVGRFYRNCLQKRGITKNVKTLEDTEEFKQAKSFKAEKNTKYLITWAQSQTDIHKNFWDNLKAYSNHLGASIHVIAGRYKNPTSVESNRKVRSEEFWSREVTPFLDAGRHQIHEYLTVLSDIKIQPTAKTPLTSTASFTGDSSCIVGHPSVHLRSCPVLVGYPEKILMTTGAVTLPNYTDTKAGKWAEFHHQFGFVIVELDGDRFYTRQVQADKVSGDFYDLKYKVSNGIVKEHNEEIPLAVLGDIHLGNHCQQSLDTALDLSDRLKVKEVVLHDLFDGYTINHHEKKDPFIQLQKEGLTLQGEIDDCIRFVKMMSKRYPKVTSVSSNHNDFLDRWLMSNDWRYNANRAEFLKLASIKATGETEDKGMIHYLIDQEGLSNVNTLGHSASYKVKGYEIALHYDKGVNGSRGSITQFKNLSTKSIGAHGHSPKKEGGSVMVGTMTKKRMGYNKGLSDWVNGLAIVYPNGMVSHIHIIKGKYTTLM